jgi:hypothetical protein
MAEESEQERLNRELIELLNELRVVLPGVQFLPSKKSVGRPSVPRCT